MEKLSNKEYAELKNTAYYAYDFYSKASREKANQLLGSFLDKYSTNDEKQIFTNTVLCPYDMELYKYLENKKLSSEIVADVCSQFGITEEILNQKVKEYFNYSYLKSVGEGLIDYSIIHELSKEFLDKNQPSDNKNK